MQNSVYFRLYLFSDIDKVINASLNGGPICRVMQHMHRYTPLDAFVHISDSAYLCVYYHKCCITGCILVSQQKNIETYIYNFISFTAYILVAQQRNIETYIYTEFCNQ